MEEIVRFARLLEVDNQQVLIIKDYNDDKFKITQVAEIEGVRVELKLAYGTEDARDSVFEAYDNKLAKEVLNMIYHIMEDES